MGPLVTVLLVLADGDAVGVALVLAVAARFDVACSVKQPEVMRQRASAATAAWVRRRCAPYFRDATMASPLITDRFVNDVAEGEVSAVNAAPAAAHIAA